MKTATFFSFLLTAFFLVGPLPAAAQSYDCAAQSEVSVPECEALVALYHATDGANWEYNSFWLYGPISKWYGVVVQDGHVTHLNLAHRNNINGELPPELGQLTHLESLNITTNYYLTGTIPPELGQLANLKILDLRANNFSGGIPPELGQLTNLQELKLFRNNLIGEIPRDLGQLDSLRFLDLQENELSGSIPHELGQLTNLRYLNLRLNQLTGALPLELGQLSNLESLDLSYNQLSGTLPAELGQLSNLKWLFFANNELRGEIPTEMGQLTNLLILWLFENQFDGPLPLSFKNLTMITNLWFYDTDLCMPLGGEFPTWISSIREVRGTRIACSNFSCAVHGSDVPQTECEALAALYHATDGANWYGTDDNFWLYAPVSNWEGITVENGNVIKLEVRSKQLNGTLPPEIGELTYLQEIDVSINFQLSGALPLSITNLSDLERFNFWYTNLCIPQNDIFQTWLNTIGGNDSQITCTITEPAHGVTGVGLTPTLDWQDIAGAERYDLQLSDNASDFTASKIQTILIDETGLQESAFTVPAGVLNVDTAYFWRVRSISGGEAGAWEQASFTTSPTGTNVEDQEVPATYALAQNYPNPFNPETTIRYEIAAPEHVRLEIFDMLGRHIRTLVDRTHDAGRYEIRWNGRSAAGQPVASGLYLYRLRAESFIDSHTMHLIK